MNRKDLTGERFGKLIVIRFEGYKVFNDGHKRSKWFCKCDCGKEITVMGGALTSGNTKSCGCSRHIFDNTKKKSHGMRNSRLYRVWINMRVRCNNPKCKRYPNYGGRGIKVCEEWDKNSMAFIDWALKNGYNENLTIDRIDVDGDYEPNNCRWIDMQEQQNNRTNNRVIEFNGEKHTVKQWSRITGIHNDTLLYRLKRGWSIERTLTEPVHTEYIRKK